MISQKEENCIIITSEEKLSIAVFADAVAEEIPQLKKNNIVVDVSDVKLISEEVLNSFLKISKKHVENRKSFVLVNAHISYDNLPENLNVVPTVQEAKDIIDMEEIERDLGF